MTINEFMRILDAIRFDTEIDEMAPELRGLARQAYPMISKLYNMMCEHDLINDELNESHGNKKFNGPRDEMAAIKKANRELDFEKYGNGFKSNSCAYKDRRDKRQEKINVRNYEKYIDEAINEAINNLKKNQ
jgi:hypothetical protein